jgi:hypothetical protein
MLTAEKNTLAKTVGNPVNITIGTLIGGTVGAIASGLFD